MYPHFNVENLYYEVLSDLHTEVVLLELNWKVFMLLWIVAGVPQLPSPAGRLLWPTGCGSDRPQAGDHHTLFHTGRLLPSTARVPDSTDLQATPRWQVFHMGSDLDKITNHQNDGPGAEPTHLSGQKSVQLDRLLTHLELAWKHTWWLARCWGCHLDQSDICFGDPGSSLSVSPVVHNYIVNCFTLILPFSSEESLTLEDFKTQSVCWHKDLIHLIMQPFLHLYFSWHWLLDFFIWISLN